jgi:hypothetical protein
MKKLLSAIWGLLILFVVVVGASAVLYPPLFGTVLGFAEARWWEIVDHGKSPLSCGGSQRMTIRGKTIEVQPGDLKGPFSRELISAGGDCRIEIIDCNLKAPKVIGAGGTAHVLIQGGHIVGTEEAITAGGDAVVEVRDAKIDGIISGGGAAKWIGIEPGRYGTAATTPDAAASPADWDALACAGVAGCFSSAGFAGNVSVKVTAKVAATGKVTGADIQGEAPPAVRKCLVDSARRKTLAQYDGKPGKLVCTLVGMINGGTQMVSTTSGFSH